ncbi:MAG: hypothetical protein WCJ26_10180 [bacterium]
MFSFFWELVGLQLSAKVGNLLTGRKSSGDCRLLKVCHVPGGNAGLHRVGFGIGFVMFSAVLSKIFVTFESSMRQ